jgi:hypothetical protein
MFSIFVTDTNLKAVQEWQHSSVEGVIEAYWGGVMVELFSVSTFIVFTYYLFHTQSTCQYQF